MKKLLLILLFLMLSPFAHAQETVTILKSDMIQLAETITRQLKRDSIQTLRIANLKKQILQYENIQQSDSTLLYFANQRTNLYKEEIVLFQGRVDYLEKSNNHWSKKPLLWFIIGAGSLYLASEVVSNVN